MTDHDHEANIALFKRIDAATQAMADASNTVATEAGAMAILTIDDADLLGFLAEKANHLLDIHRTYVATLETIIPDIRKAQEEAR